MTAPITQAASAAQTMLSSTAAFAPVAEWLAYPLTYPVPCRGLLLIGIG